MEDKKFGDAGNRMVIEEFMTGREVSVLAFCDGKTIKCMTSAQDHKRAKDGDQGLNTSGMGTFSPSPFYTKEEEEFCEKYVYQPTMDAMAAEGRPFVGILFTGLMLTEARTTQTAALSSNCRSISSKRPSIQASITFQQLDMRTLILMRRHSLTLKLQSSQSY